MKTMDTTEIDFVAGGYVEGEEGRDCTGRPTGSQKTATTGTDEFGYFTAN